MKAVNLPPFFSTGDPGSFAQRTIRVRKPAIIDKILDVNEFSDEQRRAMLALKEELLHGTIGNPFVDPSYNFNALDSESIQMWEGVMPAYRGKSWLDIPFYFAESFLYLRILLAIGYFDPQSSFFMRDPYRPFKMNELFSDKGGLAIGRVLLQMIQNMVDSAAQLREILYNSLWGNRVDLSLFSIAEKSRDRVLNDAEGFNRGCANALSRGVRGQELRVLRLQVFQFSHQLIIFSIADFRAVQHMVPVVMMVDFCP